MIASVALLAWDLHAGGLVGVGWGGVGAGWGGMGWDGVGWGWDGVGWDGVGWDGVGWDGVGWGVPVGRRLPKIDGTGRSSSLLAWDLRTGVQGYNGWAGVSTPIAPYVSGTALPVATLPVGLGRWEARQPRPCRMQR